MPDALDTFLAEHAAQPWAWGSVDGFFALADWALASGHPDPAARCRGAYVDVLGWWRLVVSRGGLLPLINDGCDRAGLAPATTPVRGTIGVIGQVRMVQFQWCAIHDGTGWLVRDLDGFHPVDAPMLGAWGT